MADEFQYDLFLSHSAKDKDVVRPVAERLRADGLHVWFDEWEIKPGDSIPAKVEEGLERSRVLVLCMSANAFGSDWAHLEAGTFRFRDPLNKGRRFIPLRLDKTPIKGSLAQFRYITWRPDECEKACAELIAACRPAVVLPSDDVAPTDPRSPIATDRDPKRPKRKIVKRTPNSLEGANPPVMIAPPTPRTTIWVLGSYSELETLEVSLVRKVIATLGSSLAARGVRLVSGQSDMLNELAAHYRHFAMTMNPRGPLPIILDGRLRRTDLRVLFCDTIGGIPDLAIVVGGGVSRGRVAEECDAAEKAGIPILPVAATGGAAAQVRLTAHNAIDLLENMGRTASETDATDLVAALLMAVDRYARQARQAISRPTSNLDGADTHSNERLTRLEINKLVKRYIGVNGGYLGDFSYRTHQDFYLDLGLDIDPNEFDGTTRARFIKILSESASEVQARILEGILDKYPVGSSSMRTHKQRAEIVGWITRLRA